MKRQSLSYYFEYVFDNLFDILTILISGYIIIRHQIRPFQSNDIAELATWILAVLGLIAVSGIWERNRRLYRIEKFVKESREIAISSEKKIYSLASISIIRNSEEFYRTITDLLSEADKFDSTTFSSIAPTELTGAAGDSVKKYLKSVDAILKKNKTFRYRRIAVIPTLEKLNWLKETIESSNQAPNYHLATFGTQLPFPTMNLLIVDATKAFIWGGQHQKSEDTNYIYIDDLQTVEIIQDYYNELWRTSTKIKEGGTIQKEMFEEITKKITDTN